MHVTIGSARAGIEPKRRKGKRESGSSKYAIGEINAYIAIRDELLAEAEQLKTASKLDGLAIANDFVESCLACSRPPYQAQFLPEADAVRERRRCCDIRHRVADLRDHIELRSSRGRRNAG